METPKPKDPTIEIVGHQYNVDFGDALISIAKSDVKSKREALKLAKKQYNDNKESE